LDLKEKVAKARHARERAAAGLPETEAEKPMEALDLFSMKRKRRRT
ncbi:unnamed protein product, partial [Tilletia caries]